MPGEKTNQNAIYITVISDKYWCLPERLGMGAISTKIDFKYLKAQ